MGENGAGKTTLFNCMTGIYDYTGSITKSKTLKAGYLSASNFFYSQITGLEYLEFCMKAKGLPVSTLTIQHLNEIFQLPLDRYAAEYSTGMKKKLGFMALLLQENDSGRDKPRPPRTELAVENRKTRPCRPCLCPAVNLVCPHR